MRIEMEFNFKKLPADLSPDTVLPQRHCPNIGNRVSHSRVLHKDEVLRIKEGFTEISFRRYRSTSCRTPCRSVGLEANVQLKRSSVHESSRDARKMSKMSTSEGRKKIELSCGSDISLSSTIVDSLCSSDDENKEKRHPPSYMHTIPKSTNYTKAAVEPCPSDSFIEICPNLGKGEKKLADNWASCLIDHSSFGPEQFLGPQNDGNHLLERDKALKFQNSLSAKVDMTPPSPSASESDTSSRASAKSLFRPMRKIFDPFTKSKSLRSPLGYSVEHVDTKTTRATNMRWNQTCRKSLLHDFSHKVIVSDFEPQLTKKDHHQSSVASSPVHLRGYLKLGNKHGVPLFEFSLNCPEEAFVAKTWKSDSAFNWVYTFHSISSRKKSNASGWGATDGNKESLLVGQMQVSGYLHSESSDERVFKDSMVTEFILYDILHARKCVSMVSSPDAVKPPNDSDSCLVRGTCQLDEVSNMVKLKDHCDRSWSENNCIFSNPYPCASEVLHPRLQIAAIIIQLPFAKRESLKYKRGNVNSDNKRLNLLNVPVAGQRRFDIAYKESSDMVKVIIPDGHHNLANDETRGPSSLLERWRLGGGCDCGGWDMACPLTVLDNMCSQNAQDQPFVVQQQPVELFVQGAKEKIPALTMTVVEEGQYAVDFHAQLSTLQAFSICVAMLHSQESSITAGEDRSKQLWQCHSLKALVEEEGKLLMTKAFREKEEKNALKKMEEMQLSYVINPLFSPIGRV